MLPECSIFINGFSQSIYLFFLFFFESHWEHIVATQFLLLKGTEWFRTAASLLRWQRTLVRCSAARCEVQDSPNCLFICLGLSQVLHQPNMATMLCALSQGAEREQLSHITCEEMLVQRTWVSTRTLSQNQNWSGVC